MFQVLTGEDWNSVMYLCWLAVGWPATLYFIALVIIGNFMILNLFLAILLGNFEGMEELVACPSLHTLELSANRLSSVQVAPLVLLEELWLSNNLLADAEALAR